MLSKMGTDGRRGFTLLETIVVVIVVGILAVLGMNSFALTKRKAAGKEAIANMRIMMAAYGTYRMEHPGFAGGCICNNPVDCNGANGCNRVLRLNLMPKPGLGWRYMVVGGVGFFVSAFNNECVYNIVSTVPDDVGSSDPVRCP
jgi:prepilin-type N-terminal cleavage/methylation domain-containing protein